MRRPFDAKSTHLGQSSDLTLLAPLRQGWVDSLEAVTYKSRTKRLLQALHGMRSRSHEYAHVRLVSDAVERVEVIQSVRVVVIEPQDLVMLSVSFDGNWNAYLRTLWHRVGGLLDLIFCNTVDYDDARLNSFETWAAWVRRVQTETPFFYGPPATTARDLLFQRRQERDRLAEPAGATRDLAEISDVLPSAEDEVKATADPAPAVRARDLAAPLAPRIPLAAQLQQGLRAAAALYQVGRLYLPGTPDGDRLHRAAIELLGEFVTHYRAGHYTAALDLPAGNLGRRFARELQWLFPPQAAAPGRARAPALPWPADLGNVQGGVLKGWDGVTHGALVLVSFPSPAGGAAFLRAQRPDLTCADPSAAPSHRVIPGQIVRTIAFTMDGLYALGADSSLLDAMPVEFRDGMAARAGLLGDVRHNHPDRWRTPLRWQGGDGRIALGAVHAVVQLRTNADDTLLDVLDPHDARHPLHAAITAIAALAPQVQVLAVEPMRRLYREPAARQGVHEHFGYGDGMGQPQIATPHAAAADYDGNLLPVGELLCGYPNTSDMDRTPNADGSASHPPVSHWLHDGSFLVLRKYRQFVDRFEAALVAVQVSGGAVPSRDEVAAKLMGREFSGQTVVAGAPAGNAFDYRGDRDGAQCPLTSHARRANPRETAGVSRVAGSRPARIMRRSMSYGPTAGEGPADAERGMVFMAYNSSIAEQFEVVQRWLTGGNSTGSSSGVSCPIMGVPESGRRRHFRFAIGAETAHVTLDGSGPLLEDPQPLVQLEWGAYLWLPSLATIDALANLADASGHKMEKAWDLEHGRALLRALPQGGPGGCPHAIDAWKSVLEDVESVSRYDSASVWAAIRADEGGVLRTPYGVLVGDVDMLHRTLADPHGQLTVSGYQDELRQSIGEIYLGVDDTGAGGRYRDEADPINQAIAALDLRQAFELARDTVSGQLDALVAQAQALATLSGNPRYETSLDPQELVDEVLARLCETWCGLDTAGGHLARGPMRLDWQPGQPPLYPGHFTAPSRCTFQPHPGAMVQKLARDQGPALRAALLALVQDWQAGKPTPHQPLALAILDHPRTAKDPDFGARALAGTVMGFVPTLDGALRVVVQSWLRTGTLWVLRAALAGRTLDLKAASGLLRTQMQWALQLHPVPDMVWRQAVDAQQVGGEAVAKGERLVFGLGSASQQLLEQCTLDIRRTMFGGVRAAQGPTHACPAFEVAQAVMLGALAGLVCSTQPLAPVHGTPLLRMEG